MSFVYIANLVCGLLCHRYMYACAIKNMKQIQWYNDKHSLEKK